MPREPPVTSATLPFRSTIHCPPDIDPAAPACYRFTRTISGSIHMARLGFRRLPRPPPSHRRKSDAAVPARHRTSSKHLDELGYDEFWCGEHHSSGWEMIASPEMFLAAAGEHTKRIKLAHRRDLAALPQPLQRRAAHGAARPHDRRPRDLRLRPRRAALRRLHARHRSDDPARPPGRGASASSAACSAASASRRRASGTTCTTPACSSCRCRRRCPSSSPRRSARRA